ncbi:HNH endonuclease [Mesorhizobium sp. NZP2077]|nr:HNH endonuclease [Mesorhizobium sp. NZP2077]
MSKSNKLAKLKILRANKQNWRCFYCDYLMWQGDPTRFAARYSLPGGFLNRFQCTAEHMQPRENGGEDRHENIVAACKFCNQTRHRMSEVLTPAAYRQHVRKRVRAGGWHPRQFRHLLKEARHLPRPKRKARRG